MLKFFSTWIDQIFCAAGDFFKNAKKDVFFLHFLKNVDEKIAFFRRALPPSKLVYIGAFKQILGSVGQKWFLKKYQRGDPLGWQGVESLREGASAPPLNPLLYLHLVSSI